MLRGVSNRVFLVAMSVLCMLVLGCAVMPQARSETHRTGADIYEYKKGTKVEDFLSSFHQNVGPIGALPMDTNTVVLSNGNVTVYIYDVYDSRSVRAGAPFVSYSLYVGFQDGKLLEYGYGRSWRAWSKDFNLLIASLTSAESFWELGERPCEVEWTASVYKVLKSGKSDGSMNIEFLVDAKYLEGQTKYGLLPNPVKVIVPAGTEIARQFSGSALKAGVVVAIKGKFKGFRKMDLVRRADGQYTATGKSTDVASVVAMAFGMQDASAQAREYAAVHRLEFGTRFDGKMVLPDLQVEAESVTVLK